MNREIEVKAWIDEPERIKKILTGNYGEYAEIEKDDIYYRYPAGQLVRLRREAGRSCVTVKSKNLEGGIEVNEELEFDVDDGDGFIDFCRMTGAEEYITKTKRGYRFDGTKGEVIELCKVGNLGWFLEVEKVVTIADGTPESDERRVKENAKECIMKVLEAAGIPESCIEKRYYSEMLLSRKESESRE